jgi:hypothetical protein
VRLLDVHVSRRPTPRTVDFHVLVLGTAHWPLTPPTTELNIPADLLKTYERFMLYYNNKHSVCTRPIASAWLLTAATGPETVLALATRAE